MSDGDGRAARTTVTTAGPRMARVRRAALPASTTAEGLPTRRRWGRVAGGAALALLGGWIFASLYLSAGERVEVLAVAQEVDRFETIEEDDLRTVRVAADRGVDTVGAGDADELVGRAAATDLVPGSLLAPDQVVPTDARLVDENEAVVGALLAPGDAPAGALAGGVEVMVVVRPSAAGATPTAETDNGGVEGWLLAVGEADENTGDRRVEIVVPELRAAEVTAAAADDRVSLVVLEG